MKQVKQDRRSQRTRKLISTAMMDLLFAKRYEAITVQDILNRANIGRSTFYTHYFDKEDVLAQIADQQLELLSQQLSLRDADQGIIPSLEIFQHVQHNQQFFHAMLRGHAGEVLWDASQAALSKTIEQRLVTMDTETLSHTVPLVVVSQYLAGAYLNLLKWWIEAEMPYSPAQMDALFQQLTLPGVRSIIEGQRTAL